MKKDKTEKVITDNSAEKLVVKWDTVRFALILTRKNNDIGISTSVIILNLVEGMALLKFLASCGKEE